MGSIAELNAFEAELALFFASPDPRWYFPLDGDADPFPYEESLPGIEFTKTEGPILAVLGEDHCFSVSGSVANLCVYGRYFRFSEDEEGEHHHPDQVKGSGYFDPGSLCLIIEAEFE